MDRASTTFELDLLLVAYRVATFIWAWPFVSRISGSDKYLISL